MLLFKRLLTTLVLFIVLFFVVFFGALVVGGAIAGAQVSRQANATTFDEGYAAGQKVGAEFAQKWGVPIRNIALGVAVVGAFGLSFSGALPWCRRRPTPPPLPSALP